MESKLSQSERTLITHRLFLSEAMKRLPTDYGPYGFCPRQPNDGDCSCGCKWRLPLAVPFDRDWLVCANRQSPRCGLLTFEHQGCQEFEIDDDGK